MYQNMAEDEDNKMAERWQKDAEGILFFVSFSFHTTLHISSRSIEWFILRRCCGIGHSDRPGPPAPGYICILSREYL